MGNETDHGAGANESQRRQSQRRQSRRRQEETSLEKEQLGSPSPANSRYSRCTVDDREPQYSEQVALNDLLGGIRSELGWHEYLPSASKGVTASRGRYNRHVIPSIHGIP